MNWFFWVIVGIIALMALTILIYGIINECVGSISIAITIIILVIGFVFVSVHFDRKMEQRQAEDEIKIAEYKNEEAIKQDIIKEKAINRFNETNINILSKIEDYKYEVIIGDELYHAFVFDKNNTIEVKFLKIEELN